MFKISAKNINSKINCDNGITDSRSPTNSSIFSSPQNPSSSLQNESLSTDDDNDLNKHSCVNENVARFEFSTLGSTKPTIEDFNKSSKCNNDETTNPENQIDFIKSYHDELTIGDDISDDDDDEVDSSLEDNNWAFNNAPHNKADYIIHLLRNILTNNHYNGNKSILIDFEKKQTDSNNKNGVFATQFVQKGAPIKRCGLNKSEVHCVEMTEEECQQVLSSLNDNDCRLFLSNVHSVSNILDDNKNSNDENKNNEIAIFDADDFTFINCNQQKANIEFDKNTWTYIATRDINKNEEILKDYHHQYCASSWLSKLYQQHGLSMNVLNDDASNNDETDGHFQLEKDNSLKIKDG